MGSRLPSGDGHNQRTRKVTDLKTRYTITHNFGQVPNQIHATGPNGEEYYLRGRSDFWELYLNDGDDPIYEGKLYGAGYLELADWEMFFWDVIRNCVENGNEHPQMTYRNIGYYERGIRAIYYEVLSNGSRYAIPVDEVMKIIRKNFPDLEFWR